MNLTDLLAALAPVGVPVLPPGTPTGTLPAIVIDPGDWSFGEGGRRLVATYDVTVVVPRDDQVTRLVELDDLTRLTIETLLPVDGIRWAGDIRFSVGGPPDAPAFLARAIPIAYIDTEIDLCPS